MAISSPGIGSGLDINSLITGLMAVEKQPIDRLVQQQKQIQNQISAYGKIKSALDVFQKAAEALSKPDSLFTFAGSLSDKNIATVTGSSNAVAGTYSLEVEQLASAHKLKFSAPASIPAGSLTISVGDGDPVTVDIAEGASLSDVRDAINNSNSGVSATIVNGKDGPQLVMTSAESGANNTIKIGASAGLEAFAFDPASQADVDSKQITAAQNAILYIDGIKIESASNKVENAVTGITLDLTKTTDAPVTLTVTNDTEALTKKIEEFVKAYNDVRSTLKDLSKYDPTTKAAGVLNGDMTISTIQNQLRGILSSRPDGMSAAFPNLDSLGIASNSDGTLVFNADKMKAGLEKDSAGFANTLSAFGAAFSDTAKKLNDTEGLVTTRTDSLSATTKRMDERVESMNRRLVQVEARYRSQFSALDVLMAKMQTTSSYLSQQLASLQRSAS